MASGNSGSQPVVTKDISRPEPALVEALRRLNGTADALLANHELLQLLLPIIRADLAIHETYRYYPEPPLACAIVAFGGRDDQTIPIDAVNAWRSHTTGPFVAHVVAGDHFFVVKQRAAVLELLGAALRRTLSEVR